MNNLDKLHSNNHPNINEDCRRALNYDNRYFPKEFQRNLIDTLDKRFLLIWMLSFVVLFSGALYFSINPPTTGFKQPQIDRIQKQFVTMVLQKENVKAPVEPESLAVNQVIAMNAYRSSKDQVKGESGSRGGSQSNQVTNFSGASISDSYDFGRSSGNGKGLASLEQISQEVSSKGLLGLLTSSGNNAQREAVTDVLGEAVVGQGNLDKVWSSLDSLKKTGKSAAGAIIKKGKGQVVQKGTRSTESGGIDELLVEKGQAKSTNIQRTGSIVIEDVSEIADERGIKSESRDLDKVSEVVNRHSSSIQYCYQRELKQNPDLKGKLVVRITIGYDGKIKDVNVISSTLNSLSIERCIISRIKRWDDFGAIDPAKGDATFKQVYTFGY